MNRPAPLAWRRARRALLLALLLCGACARTPYVPAPLDPAAAPALRAQARLDDAAYAALLARHAPRRPFPPPAWSCRELGVIAAARSGALAAAQARLRAEEAAREVAGQRPNPRVALEFQYNTDKDPGDDSHYSIGPSFSWLWSPVDRGRIRVALADAGIVTARTALLEAAWAARDRACSAASALRAAREAHRAREREAALLDAAVELARARAAAGISDAFEWQSLTLEANGARLGSLERLARVGISGAELAAALDLAPSALGVVPLAADERAAAVPALDALRVQALGHHPRILAALAAYDAAEHDLELAVAAQYPDIELSPGYFFDQGDHVWSLLGGVVVPLFASHDAAIAAAEARRDAARAAFEQTQREVIAALEQAYATWQAQQALHAAVAETAAAVAQSVEDFARRQREGLGDGLMLKRAELQHAQVAVRAVDVAAGLRRALLALERAAAVPLDDAGFAAYLDALYTGASLPGEGR